MCIMTDVNLGDVVEILDLLISPTVYQLGLSVYFVVLPSVQQRGVICRVSVLLFLHPWLSDDLFLPCVVTTFLSSRNNY